MKACLLLLTAFAFSLFAQAQSKSISEEEVPASVKAEFSKTHPGAFEISWKQKDMEYVVAYSYTATKSYVTYSDVGKMIESRDKITTFALPTPAYEYIKLNYPESQKEYFKIIDAMGVVKFAVKVQNQEILFDKKGNYLATQLLVL